MSNVRVWAPVRGIHSTQMENVKNGRLMALILPDGRSITLKVRPRIPNAFTRRKPAAGLDRSFSDRTMAARRGSNRERPPASRLPRLMGCQRERAISLFTTLRLKPVNRSRRINSMTALRIHGSSKESGILNLRSTTQTASTPALKMPPYFNRPTVVRRGLNFLVYAATARDLCGSQAPAVCAAYDCFGSRQSRQDFCRHPSRRRVSQ